MRLVGRDDAALREDQWAAIEALAVDRRRALVVQRTGWGKSAVYFVATALLRERGAGPTVIVSPLLALMRNQIAAAERAGIRAVTINSTNIEQWQPIHDADRRRRGRRAAGQPRAAQQPRLPRRGAAAAGRDARAAGRRRGALHLRLGSRLPPRLPPHPHPARRAARRASRCSRPPRPPTPASPPTSPSSWACTPAESDPRPARLPRPRVAAPRRRRTARHPSSGWPGWPSTSASCPARASSTASPSPPPRRSPSYLRARGHDGRGLLRPDRADRAAAARAGPARRPGQGAGGDQRARHGLRRQPRVRRQPRRAAVAGRLLPAGRPRRPRHRTTPRWCCCRRPRTATSGRYFASLGLPPRGARARRPWQRWRTPAKPLSTATLETHVELGRTRLETMLKVLDVDGAVQPGAGRLGRTGGRGTYDAERYAARRRGPSARAGGDARLPRHRPRAGWSSCARSSTTPRPPLRPVRQLRRPRALPTSVEQAAVGEAARAAVAARAWSSSRARCGPARWPTSGSTSGAGSASQAEEGRAVARLTDLGHGQALRDAVPRGRRGRGGPGRRWHRRWSTCSTTGRPRARRDRPGRVGPAGGADRATSPRASRATSRSRSSGHWAIVDDTVAPGRGR